MGWRRHAVTLETSSAQIAASEPVLQGICGWNGDERMNKVKQHLQPLRQAEADAGKGFGALYMRETMSDRTTSGWVSLLNPSPVVINYAKTAWRHGGTLASQQEGPELDSTNVAGAFLCGMHVVPLFALVQRQFVGLW